MNFRKWCITTGFTLGAVVAAWAASSTLANLSAVSSVGGTDLFYDVQTPGAGGLKATAAQIAAYTKTTLQTIGSWTPVDASGASLTFSSVSANYTQIGNIVFAYGELTYPATANGSVAIIGGLPVSIPNQPYAQGGCIIGFRSSSVVLNGTYTIQNTATFAFITGTSMLATNAQMTGVTITFNCIYPAA